jgi:hypothetical protein
VCGHSYHQTSNMCRVWRHSYHQTL